MTHQKIVPSYFIILLLSIISNIAYSNNSLTQLEQSDVLLSIDNTCADVWCEGDFDYIFDEFNCDFNKKVCTLNFQMILEKEVKISKDSYESKLIKTTYETECTINNISSLDEIILKRNSYSIELVEPFYEKLTDCIGELESLLNP